MRKAAARATTRLDALVDEHRVLDERVRQLGKRPYLTPLEQVEFRKLKKLKLAKKYQIVAMEARERIGL